MRVLNRSHIPWFLFVLLATVAAGWIYLGNFQPTRLPPRFALPPALVQTVSEHRTIGGTPVGLAFGTIAFAIFIFGVLLSLRKKLVLWRIGSVQSWLRAHIWLTLLTVPLVLFHSGFRLGGPSTILLMALYAVVMVSGIYGLILQHRIPRLMQERFPNEVVYEQIPHLRSQLFRAAQTMAASLKSSSRVTVSAGPASAVDPESEAALVTLLEEQVMPYLKVKRAGRRGLDDSSYAEDTFRFVRLKVAEPYRERVGEIQGWCEERRMLDGQLRLHHWLHAWLFLHVPVSFLLLLLTAWHGFVSLFYY